MNDLPTAPVLDVAALHLRWHEYHSVLRDRETQLSAALAAYTQGQSDLPDQLMDEVKTMRVECNARFRALMDALQLQANARQTGTPGG